MHLVIRLVAAVSMLAALSACEKKDTGGEPKAPGTAKPAPTPDPGTATVPAHGAPTAEAPKAKPVGKDGTKVLGAISVVLPDGWVDETPKTNMRVAQFSTPHEGVELVVYYFGKGGAGAIDENLERWYGQFEQADGKASKDVAKTEKKEVSGLAVHTVELGGKYVAAVRPGQPDKHSKPDHAMLAAIVESDIGPYFFKLLGPKKSVADSKAGFDAMIASVAKVDGTKTDEDGGW